MADANIIGGLLGGALIGLAAALLLAFNGRIAGISGILAGLLTAQQSSERFWRLAFLCGLLAGAALYRWLHGALPLQFQSELLGLAGAGLFVGFGTRLGSGCTSGHGVCGLARLSPRSLAATMTFIILAVVTVYMTRHVL